ncbi:MAG TPA: GAF domain-containing sensor histidine kinase [Actinomycetota bacterium]|nr:GAF domain-containing sensor histidine kinase [Actinomycetota bacterium]
MSTPDRRLSALVDAGLSLAADLDLDSLLQRVADLAREVIGARYAAVGVVREGGGLAEFIFSGIDRAQADEIGDLPHGRGVLGVLIEEGKPLRLHDISDHPRSYGFPANHPPMHSFLGVPIVVRGHVFGRLYLTEKHDGLDFTKDDERMAMTLAAQAGAAVENARLYEEIRDRNEELTQRISELASVERLGELIISAHDRDQLLRTAVEEARKLTGARVATLLLLDPETGDLIVREAEGADRDLIGVRLPAGTSKAHAVIDRLTAETVDDLGADEEVHSATVARLGARKAGAFAPLMIAERGIGAMAVYDPDSDVFDESDLMILQVVANQAAIALENDRLRNLVRDLAILEERERISKDLHDGVIQSIYSVGLSLQGSLSLLEKNPPLARERVDDAIAELDNVVRDVRSYIFELQPKLVEEKGFVAAVHELAKDLEVNALVTTDVSVDEACGDLDETTKIHTIQLLREVLSNIARHGQASHVEVSCRLDGNGLTLAISDDGVGFDPDLPSRGRGLKNIRDRAERLQGTLRIEPRVPRGMNHILTVPELGGSGD